ncbi:glycine--tRNA ligase subunit beta [Orrella daihaiensis]|uniref:Glycine--tRNA ligase beta subunit n=1 Tax=Orrella daihaiensis TaxID=2782176 RepID=A0ABY4AJ33_9BURK|nr:glycine--tRNA ligase subunit beta [Orrella daihaiensis]UOD49953.1 glycine--tRNA ligase subunit beta [Orrella daihaiensis]
MSHAPLLVELFTEELPPKALERLGLAFSEGIASDLKAKALLSDNSIVTPFATPRRLAVHITDVLDIAPDQAFSEKLMPVKVGLDDNGLPTPALLKKLAAKGLSHLTAADLTQTDDGKQAYLVAQGMAPGARLAEVMQSVIETAIEKLPIPKVMRYQLADGKTSVNFVRPAHGLMVLHGQTVVPAKVLGLDAGRITLGHRFLATSPISIESADTYETQLAEQGHVTASFEGRRAFIGAKLQEQAQVLGATLGDDPAVQALLNEVTALVEAPAIYVGQFEERFLAVPSECLILTMRLNQKYFPLFDAATGELTHRFLIVSNMPISDPSAIIGGNERVVRPRLADAEFFFLTDKKEKLADRVLALDNIVYHNKLGTQRVRIERVRQIADWLARALGTDTHLPDRAALLAKADLTTQMVGEFPELQGVMGGYYAEADGEPEAVVHAIANQYQIRWPTAVTATDLPGVILFMADRAETLIGIWGIGLAPTGERDPFGLRRAALGLISAIEQLRDGGYLKLQAKHELTLETLLAKAFSTFDQSLDLAKDTVAEVSTFVRERYRNQLLISAEREAVDAVFALDVALHEAAARIAAAQAFKASEAAPSLVAANKRIGNLLKKAEDLSVSLDAAALTDAAEIDLAKQLEQLAPDIEAHMANAQYEQALTVMAQLRMPVDRFFEEVMVMAEDPGVRQNRLALLARLHQLMNQVADISRLAA